MGGDDWCYAYSGEVPRRAKFYELDPDINEAGWSLLPRDRRVLRW